ncbi:MAG: ThiF family adenylyltransferase, partial [Proteobacteria bacterium]|nr:ThiF family adenylyltransferase [Pseudomonadota bacterium]
MVEIRLTGGQHAALRDLLLTRRDVESKAFVLCGVAEGHKRTVLLGREVVPVPDGAYAERSLTRVVTRGEFVAETLDRCPAEGLALLEAHSHPWGDGAAFSPVDDASDERKFRATAGLPAPFRHATSVFGADMGFAARLFDPARRRSCPVERLTIVSDPIRRYQADGTEAGLPSSAGAAFDRQVGAFGAEGQQALSALTVAVVGAGGLGGQVALALSLLGVGHLVLIDPDRLEASNANRAVAVTGRQVRLGKAKVVALRETLGKLFAPPAITAVRQSVTDPVAWPHLLDADLVVGAVDSAAARSFLNAFCACCLLPYLDGGVGVKAEGGQIAAAGGQVRTVLPGETPCLACYDAEAGRRAVEAHTPGQRALARAAGYVQGEHIPAPQVVFLNGIVGNALVWEAVKLTTGCLPAAPYV